MRIKTSELTGAALDWAVAECQGIARVTESGFHTEYLNPNVSGAKTVLLPFPRCYSPSTRWAQGGPIIEQMRGIKLKSGRNPKAPCYAHIVGYNGVERWHQTGKTLLIAAMRCYVASKLGDEVDVPEELA